ncbi:MAG TPA: class D sortase [Bryobacteraceae bacterium]
MIGRFVSRLAVAEVLFLLVGSSLWATAGSRVARYAAFQSGLEWIFGMQEPDNAPARLSIPRLGMSVLVVDGADERSLALGAGRIHGTARIGERGNVVIAGHRDMAFRALRDVKAGDEVRVVADGTTYKYIVNRIRIVEPSDVSVLHDDGVPKLTLITCYPFCYVGDAPQRYVVEAEMFQ